MARQSQLGELPKWKESWVLSKNGSDEGAGVPPKQKFGGLKWDYIGRS